MQPQPTSAPSGDAPARTRRQWRRVIAGVAACYLVASSTIIAANSSNLTLVAKALRGLGLPLGGGSLAHSRQSTLEVDLSGCPDVPPAAASPRASVTYSRVKYREGLLFPTLATTVHLLSEELQVELAPTEPILLCARQRYIEQAARTNQLDPVTLGQIGPDARIELSRWLLWGFVGDGLALFSVGVLVVHGFSGVRKIRR